MRINGKKLKIGLAVLLFQERSISLGKATELAGMSRMSFMRFLKEHGIPPHEHRNKDFDRDQHAIADYWKGIRAVSPDPKVKF